MLMNLRKGKLCELLVSKINWPILVVACATIGLAPLFPEPHVWEKLRMLVQGNLTVAIDWFDLLMHGTPLGFGGAQDLGNFQWTC